MSTSSITNTDEAVLSYLSHHRDAVPAIRNIRSECFDYLRQTGLPGSKHEEYRSTPITRALEKFDFGLKKAAVQPHTTDIDYTLPGLEALSLVFVNGVFDASHSSVAGVEGLVVRPLAEALGEGIGMDHFSKIAVREDPFIAWNTLGWDHGLYIEVKDNTVIDKPVVVYHLTNANEQQVIAINRNLIVVGKNARLTVIQKYNSGGPEQQHLNTVTEAFVADNARLDHYAIQDSTGNQIQFNQFQAQQKNSSRVNTYTFTLQGKLIRNNLGLALDGEGCESHMYGLYLLNGDTLADNHTVADHVQPNSFSNELYKGIMDGHSRGVFNGKIYVRPNAQKTNAFQSNRNILLSDDAKVNTKPQLEIWADDVKCSHGCTTGQLDEEAMFYLQTRGIPRPTAKAMLLYAFAGELIEVIDNPAVKQYLAKIVRERLQQST